MFLGFLQVWQLGSSSPNFTLEGHEKGVNCIDYYSGGDKPYLISGADDRQVKIWDYQVGEFHLIFLMLLLFTCATAVRVGLALCACECFTHLSLCVVEQDLRSNSGGPRPKCLLRQFPPRAAHHHYWIRGWWAGIPLILTCAPTKCIFCHLINYCFSHCVLSPSTGTVRIWHSSTYRLESTLNYGMERVWCVSGLRGSNNVALGYDEGSIIIKVRERKKTKTHYEFEIY